jgi:hypothetical protein
MQNGLILDEKESCEEDMKKNNIKDDEGNELFAYRRPYVDFKD